MTLKEAIDMFAGQDGYQHVLEVPLSDLREWQAEIDRLREELRAVQKRLAKLERYNEGFHTSAALRKLAHDNVERVRELGSPVELPTLRGNDRRKG